MLQNMSRNITLLLKYAILIL